MHPRSFSLDKLRNRVSGRRLSELSLLELALITSGDRRNSISNPMIVISESRDPDTKLAQQQQQKPARFRAQSLSVAHPSNSRSRSGSRTGSKRQTKDLIRQETAHIILKKLASVLHDLGLQEPIPLPTCNGNSGGPMSRSVKIYVANTHDCIYLAPASSASFTYEDVENGGVPQNDETDPVDPVDPADVSDVESTSVPSESAVPPVADDLMLSKMVSFNSPNYLCTKIDADTPIPHTFAVIVELDKDASFKDVKIEFSSQTNILWPSGDPYNKMYVKEKFKIGSMEWQTSLANADYYINTSNSNDIKTKKLSPQDLALRTREYKLKNPRQESGSDSSLSLNKETTNGSDSTTSPVFAERLYKAGIYMFLLPVLLPEHIPPTITSVNGSLVHNLSVKLNRISDKLNRKSKVVASYNVPMARTPPSFANSTADKPIYVNRVWNDSLHYVITFPKKYVSLGLEHVINVKIVPLIKDVVVKRIKFNILERITYVSKNMSKEYDYDGDDPYLLKPFIGDSKARERVVPVCELKTKNKPSASTLGEPYKEEVIKCPDNNLLFSCYEPEDLDSFSLDDPLSKPSKEAMIASPLDINIALPFLTTRSDKALMTSSTENYDDDGVTGSLFTPLSNPTSRKASIVSSPDLSPFTPSSPFIGSLETNIVHATPEYALARTGSIDSELRPESSLFMHQDSHNSKKENIAHGYTTVAKALCPDSNFRHIQVHHRLQVCFRISKPDANDDYKMHHYEVVVDTPVILLSAKCNDDSIQLPNYYEIANEGNDTISFRTPNFERNGVTIKPLDQQEEPLPSFQEAMSAPTSPITRSISLGDTPLSRDLSICIPSDPVPSYEMSTGPLNIDEMVQYEDAQAVIASARRSTIKNSLLNSFAPKSLEDADDVSTTATSSSNGVTSLSSGSVIDSTAPTTEEEQTPKENTDTCVFPSIQTQPSNVPESPQSDATPEDPTDGLESELTDSAHTDSVADNSSEISLDDVDPVHPTDNALPDTVLTDDDASIFTQATQDTMAFEQRLPLLRNQSLDGLSRSVTSFSIKTTKDPKQLNENLSVITENNQPHDLYNRI